MIETKEIAGPAAGQWFATTHWSVVLAAGQGESTEAGRALATLCQTYWYPLYSYIRSKGYTPADAEDFTQSFFARLLERKDWRRAERARGKFRYFLLVSVKNFLADEHDRSAALKRGGGQKVVSFDAVTAEERYRLEPVETQTPDKIFERRWGLTVLEGALNRLKAEYIVARKDELYAALECFLRQTQAAPSYLEVASRLGLTEAAVKSALHRFRQRYAELVREEIAQTVSTAAEVEEELRHMIEIMSA